jgi:hypothetical protein
VPTFSRWMPRTKSPSAAWRWGGFLTLVAVALWFLIHYSPWVPAGTAIAIVLLYVMNRGRAARLRALAAERQGESICTFARAYARGDRDPFVLRAVYEELAPYLTVGGNAIPLRPSDSLEQDLQVDGEELEFLARDLATRSGRTLTDSQDNPYHGRVKTIGDLVAFLRAQPPAVAA